MTLLKALFTPEMEQRFWDKVDKTGEHWLWLASKDGCGYGMFGIRRKIHRAHRIAWVLTNGDIPDGMQVLHACDIRACCRPSCLFLGTHDQNMKDMSSKGRGRTKLQWGEHNPAAKITQATADAIKVTPGPQRKVAALFGVSQSLVCMIRKGKRWGHVS
jgi:hypothetical protein